MTTFDLTEFTTASKTLPEREDDVNDVILFPFPALHVSCKRLEGQTSQKTSFENFIDETLATDVRALFRRPFSARYTEGPEGSGVSEEIGLTHGSQLTSST